jgi:hypothetical protein
MKLLLFIKVVMVIVLIQKSGVERAPFTHPDIATLVTPLFAFGGKRGTEISLIRVTLFTACGREGGPAKRRPGESTPTGKRFAY